MVRIKNLTATSAEEIDNLADARFAIDHIVLDATRQITLAEIQEEITEVRSLTLTGSVVLAGPLTEFLAVGTSTAGLSITVPAGKSAVFFNTGTQSIDIITASGTIALPTGAYIRIHWTGAAHTASAPVTGIGQTDITLTRTLTTNVVNSSTGADATLILVDGSFAGIMPGMASMLISPPSGPPAGFDEYLWGFQHTSGPTGTVKAYKFDYEITTSSHGRTTASDLGKPVVWPTSGTIVPLLDDTSTTQFPTGILKRADATKVVLARPGDVLRIPTTRLQGGNSYSTLTSGRYLFWDLSQNGNTGMWVPTKPADSDPRLPDLLEVLRVNHFGDSTFEARVRDFGPQPPLSGSGGGATEIVIGSAAPVVAPTGDQALAVASGTSTQIPQLFYDSGAAWSALDLDRNSGAVTHVLGAGSSSINLSTGVLNRKITLNGSHTITSLTAPPEEGWILWAITQNATGGWNLTWPASVTGRQIINRTPGATTLVAMFYDGSGYRILHGRKTGAHGLGLVPVGAFPLNFQQSEYDTLSGVMDGDTTTMPHETNIVSANMDPLGITTYTVMLKQNSTGGRDITWPGSWIGTPPTARTGPNQVTVARLFYDGLDIHFI